MEELKVGKRLEEEARRSFWAEKFLDYDRNYSGMSYKAFCQSASLNYAQLKYWRRRLNHQKSAIKATGNSEKKISFIPVEMSPLAVSEKCCGIEFYYGQAYRFVLPLNVEKITLLNLFRALEEQHVTTTVRG